MTPVLDLRKQEPLSDELRGLLAAEITRREEEDGARTAGQTMLSHADNCLRAAALYLIFGGGVESHNTARGTVAHIFAEEATNYLLEEGELQMPPEVAKDRMQALIEERTDYVLPEREQEALRIFAWNWAQGTTVSAETVVAVETMFTLELAGWTVRGRIDRADLLPSRELMVVDYKSGLNLPSQEDYANDFQAKTYALLVAEGQSEDGIAVGQGIPVVHTRQELPRRQLDAVTGELAHREASFTRAELHDFKLGLERLLNQLTENLESGEWKAVPGSHCAKCPAVAHCPIDARYRTEYGEQGPQKPIPTLENLAQAEETAEEWLFLDARKSGLQKALRAFIAETGSPIYLGADLILELGFQSSRSVKDHDALEAAIARSVEFGEPFSLADHIQPKTSTPFKKRRLKPEERIEE